MPDLFEKILLLKKSDIFNEINTDDLRLVAHMLEEEKYYSGDMIFEKNDQGDYMYFIVEGQIGVSLYKDNNASNFVATLGAGECFGEMNLLDELPRSASAIVVEDARVLKLSKPRLRGLIMSYPELALGMLKALSLKLRKTNLIAVNEKRK